MSAAPANRPPSVNHLAAFNAVTQPAAVRRSLPRIGASEHIEDFIEALDNALDLAFAGVDAADLTPGVDIEHPAAMLKAYLLFLVGRGAMAGDDSIDASDFDDWSEQVAPGVWRLLGFPRPPALLTVALAFSVLGNPQHQAPELRALIWAVGDFASSNLLPSLRA
jgi:hypothetical protein